MLSQHTAKHWLSVITPSLCLHGCDAAPLHLRCTRWAELKCHQDTWFFRDWNGANTKLPKLVGTQFIHVYADPSMLSAPPHSPVSRLRRTFYFYLLLFLISQRNSKKPALHWLPIVCVRVCVCACLPVHLQQQGQLYGDKERRCARFLRDSVWLHLQTKIQESLFIPQKACPAIPPQ